MFAEGGMQEIHVRSMMIVLETTIVEKWNLKDYFGQCAFRLKSKEKIVHKIGNVRII